MYVGFWAGPTIRAQRVKKLKITPRGKKIDFSSLFRLVGNYRHDIFTANGYGQGRCWGSNKNMQECFMLEKSAVAKLREWPR